MIIETKQILLNSIRYYDQTLLYWFYSTCIFSLHFSVRDDWLCTWTKWM